MAFWGLARKGSRDTASPVDPRAMFGNLREDSHRRMVALRAAIRAYPETSNIGVGIWQLGGEVDLPIRLQALRTIFVTWAGFAYSGVRQAAREEAISALRIPLARLDEALPHFDRYNFVGNENQLHSHKNSTQTARRAVALVEAIETLTFATMPFDSEHSHRDFLDTGRSVSTHRSSSQGWIEAQAAAITADCRLLERGIGLVELSLAPLWHEAWQAARETDVMAGAAHHNFRKLGSSIQRWLYERKDGGLVLGLTPAEAQEIIVKLANLPPSFWERDDPLDAIDNFDYSLLGYLDNPNWGSSTRTLTPFAREIRQKL